MGATVEGAREAAPLADEVEALEALARTASPVGGQSSPEGVLAAIARSAFLATGACLAIVRVAPRAGADLVARVVYTGSSVLAAELDGSKLAARCLDGAEAEYEVAASDDIPAGLRRAATRGGADIVRIVPVGEDAVLATLELYRRGRGFSRREQAFAQLAAAHVATALGGAQALAGDSLSDGPCFPLELAGEALAAATDETELAEHVVRVAAEATGATRSLLWRLDADCPPRFLAAHGFEPDPSRLETLAAAVGTAVDEQRARGSSANGSAATGFAADGLVLPLGEPPAGALQLVFADGATTCDADVLSAFAAGVTVALRRARHAETLALDLRRSQTVVAVVSQAIAHLSLAHTLATAVDRVSELTGSGHVAIYLRDGERMTEAASRGLVGSHGELAERLLELALGPFRMRGFLFVDDMSADARLAGLEPILAETGLRRALVVPLVVHEDVIGALAVFEREPRPYRTGEEELLVALSTQLAVAVQNARLHEQTKELGAVLERALTAERNVARQLRALFEISDAFTRSLSLDETLAAVARTVVEVFELDAAAIRMPDARRNELVAHAVHVADPALREATHALLARPEPLAAPLARRVAGKGETVVLRAPGTQPAEAGVLEPFLRKGATAAVLPLATSGGVLGTLTLLTLDPARPLSPEALETVLRVANQAALAIDHARLHQQQREFAETMQRSLLPRELPAVPGLEIGHIYESAAALDVGGDVYDFLFLEDGRLAVVLGDVSGKGIRAAADMATAKFAFRSLARSYPRPPDFLAKANEVALEEIALGKFITMLYAIIDPRSGEVACASAGHPPMRYVRPDGRVAAIPTPGLALGVDPDQAYHEERFTLERGGVLVLYTDGVVEARREGELYGETRLDACLRENAHRPAQELADAVLAECRAFSGGALGDDCAIVCLRTSP
ncbi:MAG: SpoIIE family protein phosphatase [Actinomycetota bacterium]|nr:SpoIIE family protein phosphatase [Actinomycetota bacterium]